MGILLALNRDKKAVSIIVSYVLLITITITLSVLVFNWLRFYVDSEEVPVCSDNVNIIIKSYSCFASVFEDGAWTDGNLQITLKNKGLFSIGGFHLRVHDREDAEFGFYTLDDVGKALAPGEETESLEYGFEIIDDYDLRSITVVEVQPFVVEKGKVVCKSSSVQKVVCSS
jgi:hypothetical protein